MLTKRRNIQCTLQTVGILALLALTGCGGGSSSSMAVATAVPIKPTSGASPVSLNNWNDATIWAPQDGYTNGGTFDVGWRADHAVVNGTQLDLRLDNVPCPSGCSNEPYASAELDSVAKYGYGIYTVQMQAAAGAGIVSTFFTYVNLTPNGPETNDEIDVEIPGERTNTLEATYYKLGGAGVEHTIALPFDASQAMHVYAIQWLPNSISWIVDGQTLYTANGSPSKLPTNPSALILNFWAGTSALNSWLGPFNYSSPLIARYGSASFTPM